MTKEEIKQICQIYDNFRSERDAATITYNSDNTFWEHVLATYNLSHPSLPSEIDEAAKEYAKTTFKKPHSDNPDEEVTIVEPDKYAGFIAGAKWDKEQMMSNAVEGTVYGNGVYTWVAGDIPSQFKYGDKVRVIVLPKED